MVPKLCVKFHNKIIKKKLVSIVEGPLKNFSKLPSVIEVAMVVTAWVFLSKIILRQTKGLCYRVVFT